MHDASNDWWPAHTAPFDKPVLIWDGNMMCAAQRSLITYKHPPGQTLEFWTCVGASGWECEDDFGEPTHWLALPEPPK